MEGHRFGLMLLGFGVLEEGATTEFETFVRPPFEVLSLHRSPSGVLPLNRLSSYRSDETKVVGWKKGLVLVKCLVPDDFDLRRPIRR